MADASILNSASYALAVQLREEVAQILSQSRAAQDGARQTKAGVDAAIASLAALVAAFGVRHRWVGSRLDFAGLDGQWVEGVDLQGPAGPAGPPGDDGPAGDEGPAGPAGPAPAHRWQDTVLQFRRPDGTWGPGVDLRGERGQDAPDPANLPLSRRASSFEDLFDRPDRLLNGDNSWTLSGPGAGTAAIVDGVLRAGGTTSAHNFYAYKPLDRAVDRTAFAFSFVPGTGANSLTESVVTLIACKTVGNLDDMLHCIFTPTTYALTKRVAGAGPPFSELAGNPSAAAGTYDIPLDGTVVGAALDIDVAAGTVSIVLPNGKRVGPFPDPDITALAPDVVCYQIFPYSEGYVGRIHGVSAGKSLGQTVRALSGAAAQSESTRAKSYGATTKQSIGPVTLTGSGWYRIATAATINTFLMAGEVVLTATEQYQGQITTLFVSSQWDSASPKLQHIRSAGSATGAVDQVRLSTDPTGYRVDLDIHVGVERPVTIAADFFGYFTPVRAPVIGAVAGATGSTVVSPSLPA